MHRYLYLNVHAPFVHVQVLSEGLFGLALKLHVALGGINHRPLESLYSAKTFCVGSKLTILRPDSDSWPTWDHGCRAAPHLFSPALPHREQLRGDQAHEVSDRNRIRIEHAPGA